MVVHGDHRGTANDRKGQNVCRRKRGVGGTRIQRPTVRIAQIAKNQIADGLDTIERNRSRRAKAELAEIAGVAAASGNHIIGPAKHVCPTAAQQIGPSAAGRRAIQG